MVIEGAISALVLVGLAVAFLVILLGASYARGCMMHLRDCRDELRKMNAHYEQALARKASR